MALPDVKFTTLNGGLAREAVGDDHVSGIVEQNIAAPAGFDGAKGLAVRSLAEAETKGVIATGTYAGVHYQVGEFFRLNPNGTLWIFFQVNLATEVQDISEGKVKQLAVIIDDIADVTAVCQVAATAMAAAHAPCAIIAGYQPAVYTAGSETDLGTLQADDVAVVAFGDFNARGAAVAAALGEDYTPAIGAVLGLVSARNVHESPAWVKVGNLSDGIELDRIALPDGAEATTNQIAGLHDKRYFVGRKHIGKSGTYLASSPTATSALRDVSNLETARALHKAKRLVRSYLIEDLSGPVYVERDSGLLAKGSVAYFESLANRALDVMLSAGEVSGRSNYVDPNQQILSTNKLVIRTRIVPVGKAQDIEVEIGLALQLS